MVGPASLILNMLLAPVAGLGQPVTVAALGDSLVQGFGLMPDDSFPARLEVWLRAAGEDVTVLNAGVSGDTTAGGLARIDWTLTPDVAALIVILGGNDVLRGIEPAEARRNLRGILDMAASRGLPVLLVGVEVPANYGADYKAEFEAVYSGLAEEYATLLHPSFFAALEDGIGRREALRLYMQDDGLHPNAAGVRRIVDSIGPGALELLTRARARRGRIEGD